MTSDPNGILFETSPYGNVDAIVQHDDRVVYFYLNGHTVNQKNPFGTRAVWVRNLVEGPYVLDEDEARSGLPPLLPRTHCVHPKPQPLPSAENLRVIWLEEGNGAALIETDPQTGTEQTLAVIPPWSGLEGFHGYAFGCAAECPLCWPMPDNPKLQQRITQSDQFWNACQSEVHPFASLQSETLAAFRSAFSIQQENQESYFSIDGGKFPPRGLVQFKSGVADETQLIIATVGLSLCPQPAVELFTDDPINYRRIELAVRLSPEQMADENLVSAVTEQLGMLAAYPWRNFTWLGAGHTCGLADAIPDHDMALLVHDQQRNPSGEQSQHVPLNNFRNDPVNLLWLFPITTDQQQQLESGTLTPQQVLDLAKI